MSVYICANCGAYAESCSGSRCMKCGADLLLEGATTEMEQANADSEEAAT